MVTSYKLKDYLNSIKTTYPDMKFEQIEDDKFSVYGLTEQNILDLGFEFEDYDITGTIATYKNNNLFACFMGATNLYMIESTLNISVDY